MGKILFMPTLTNSLGRVLLYCVFLLSFASYDQAFVATAWKLPFRRRGNNRRQRQQQQSSHDTSSPGTEASSSASTSPISTTSPPTPPPQQRPAKSPIREHPAILASLTAETQELIKDMEEAIDKVTRQSKLWLGKIPIPTVVRTVWDQFITIVLYKPPVGIVALLTTTRLVTSGRLFRLYGSQSKDPKASVEAALAKQQQKESEEGRRALLLDPDDVAYQRNGGVDPIRQQVCAAALQHQARQPASTKPSAAWSMELQDVLQQVIALQSTSSRLTFLQQASPLLARLEGLMGQWSSSSSSSSSSPSPSLSFSRSSSTATDTNAEQVMLVASHAVQVRTMDALLRVTRDRLLQTTHRLGRTVTYWQKRVHQKNSHNTVWQFWWLLLRKQQRQQALEQERMRLAYASAAYQHEQEQLGKVVQLLLDRPADLPSEQLLNAYKESKRVLMEKEKENSADSNIDTGEEDETMLPAPVDSIVRNTIVAGRQKLFGRLPHRGGGANSNGKKGRFQLPSLSKYYIRWRPEGKGILSLRQVEAGEELDPEVAARVLLKYENEQQDEPFAWQAKIWTQSARETICTTVQESLRGSPSKPKYDLSIKDFEQTTAEWCRGNPTSEDGWKRLLLYVDNLARWRRTGEGETVRLRDAALISWTKRLDLMGIPSTLLKIQIAYWVHNALAPHLPEFRVNVAKVFWKTIEIIQQRVWVPFKGIYDEIMNKSKGMMSGFGLQLEEQSLDHLLRDMGFGDGTPATRGMALSKAAEQYEHDLNSGVFVGLARGRLIRLLLIQVQQLKVGLLSALDTIDVLMKGNQIHFQILAAIPAVLLATFGTRFFVRFIYSIRAKDLRPVAVAHSNMASYLSQIERLILLDQPVSVDDSPDGNKTKKNPPMGLSPLTLGEVSLYMYRYLMLLDYSAPLFPASAIEQIHVSLQGLLGTTLRKDGGSTDLTLRWLDRIQNQHRDLLKHT